MPSGGSDLQGALDGPLAFHFIKVFSVMLSPAENFLKIDVGGPNGFLAVEKIHRVRKNLNSQDLDLLNNRSFFGVFSRKKDAPFAVAFGGHRSEERRGGKEWR